MPLCAVWSWYVYHTNIVDVNLIYFDVDLIYRSGFDSHDINASHYFVILDLHLHSYILYVCVFIICECHFPAHVLIQPGDEIVRVNGLTLSHATHEEVVNLIKLKKTLLLTCRSKLCASIIGYFVWQYNYITFNSLHLSQAWEWYQIRGMVHVLYSHTTTHVETLSKEKIWLLMLLQMDFIDPVVSLIQKIFFKQNIRKWYRILQS